MSAMSSRSSSGPALLRGGAAGWRRFALLRGTVFRRCGVLPPAPTPRPRIAPGDHEQHHRRAGHDDAEPDAVGENTSAVGPVDDVVDDPVPRASGCRSATRATGQQRPGERRGPRRRRPRATPGARSRAAPSTMSVSVRASGGPGGRCRSSHRAGMAQPTYRSWPNRSGHRSRRVRSIPDPGFAGDDGERRPRGGGGAGGVRRGAGRRGRHAAPCSPRSTTPACWCRWSRSSARWRTTTQGLAHDKTSDMAAVLMTGRTAAPPCSRSPARRRSPAWNPEARPVAGDRPRQAAQAALQDQAAALLVDVAGPVMFVVEGEDLRALAAARWLEVRAPRASIRHDRRMSR